MNSLPPNVAPMAPDSTSPNHQLIGTNERWLSDNDATGAQECRDVIQTGKSPETKASVYAPQLSLLLFPAQFEFFSASG
jgi:hypothetical protein